MFDAILTTACVGIALLALRFWVDKTEQKPFAKFWGLHDGSLSTGNIVLQSDRFGSLTEDLTKALWAKLTQEAGACQNEARPNDLENLLNEKDEPERGDNRRLHNCRYSRNRAFKARSWLNRCDTEGARRIREALSGRGFVPPEFKTAERGSTHSPNPAVPLEIYMGLGFTVHSREYVNKRCEGFLSIEKTGVGDAVCIATSLVGKACDILHTEPFQPHEQKQSERVSVRAFSLLFPRGESETETWNIDTYASREQTKDYAYILRDVRSVGTGLKQRKQVVFHVAGFTEDGTWAAGNYLAKNWKSFTPL